jgi:hypothetical protein
MGNFMYRVDTTKIQWGKGEPEKYLFTISVEKYTEEEIFSLLGKINDINHQLDMHGDKIKLYLQYLINTIPNLNDMGYICIDIGICPFIKIKNILSDVSDKCQNNKSKDSFFTLKL